MPFCLLALGSDVRYSLHGQGISRDSPRCISVSFIVSHPSIIPHMYLISIVLHCIKHRMNSSVLAHQIWSANLHHKLSIVQKWGCFGFQSDFVTPLLSIVSQVDCNGYYCEHTCLSRWGWPKIRTSDLNGVQSIPLHIQIFPQQQTACWWLSIYIQGACVHIEQLMLPFPAFTAHIFQIKWCIAV